MGHSSQSFVAFPPWGVMWGVALAIYVIAKLTALTSTGRRNVDIWRQSAFLLAWPGMDSRSFLIGTITPDQRPAVVEYLFAAGKLVVGIVLLGLAARSATTSSRDLLGWTGMIGIVLTLHFGLFHLLSCVWRSCGIRAVPLMHWPILAESLSDFWGRRWNLAFRDLTHQFVFRPLSRRVGAMSALMVGFLVSGLVHDLVISVPAGGGYGGPTCYFLLQGAGIIFEKTSAGRALGIVGGFKGWAFCAAVVLLPCGWLFPNAFLDNVIIPFVHDAGVFQ